MKKEQGRLIILQSGGPTPVINQTLSGIIDAAKKSGAFSGIVGALHGANGLLDSNFIDLGRQSPQALRAVASTPGASLGSARRKLTSSDLDRALGILLEYKITSYIGIGGNDSAENALLLQQASERAGQRLTVVIAPKTIDNDLPETDHCPGYGSAARFVALAAMGAGKDAEAMGKERPVTIIEVMGRNSGWLPAAAILGKREARDAPHIVCVPEHPVIEDEFISAIDFAVKKHGHAVAVVGENVRGPKGPLGQVGEPEYIDAFGHPYYPSPGEYLARAVGKSLKIRARYEKPGTLQRAFADCISSTDAREAYAVGRAAAGLAASGKGDLMVTLVRAKGGLYRCTTGTTSLANVAGKERLMPQNFFDAQTGLPTAAFVRYATPLIGEKLPAFGRLKRLRVKP